MSNKMNAKMKLQKMIKHEAVCVELGGESNAEGVIYFTYGARHYYVPQDSAHLLREFAEFGLITL